MENVSVDTLRPQQLIGLKHALSVTTAMKRPRDEAFRNDAGKRKMLSYYDDDQFWSDPKIYEQINKLADEKLQNRPGNSTSSNLQSDFVPSNHLVRPVGFSQTALLQGAIDDGLQQGIRIF